MLGVSTVARLRPLRTIRAVIGSKMSRFAASDDGDSGSDYCVSASCLHCSSCGYSVKEVFLGYIAVSLLGAFFDCMGVTADSWY